MEKYKKVIHALTWNEEFELHYGCISVSDIQDYFKYILKKADIPSIMIYISKIEDSITFKLKTRCYFELLTPKTIKLLGNTKSKITKDENDENVSHLEITEVELVHCNIVNKDYQHDSRVLYAFAPNKSFGQLLDISPRNVIFLETFNS